MDPRLLWVTRSGNVDALYSLIAKEPCLLKNLDVLPFIHTPLHEASSTGKTNLAMELMVLQPSFAKKLNTEGFSPLHLAVQNHQSELAKELIMFDSTLVRIPGRGGMTPLHHVVTIGDLDLLAEFLVLCPESIRDTNINGETAFHITVMNDKYEELKILRGWMQRLHDTDSSSTENCVLNKPNREGNTALHLAAYKNNHQALKYLLKFMSLNRNILNKSGMTALDALRANGHLMNRDTEKILKNAGGKSADSLSKVQKTSVFLQKSVTFREYCSTGISRYRSHLSDGTRNALLVITVLIFAATYETAAQPQDEEDIYKFSFSEIILKYILLWGLNTIAFLLAIASGFILLPVGSTYTVWYVLISTPLVCSYAISVYLKHKLLPLIFLLMHLLTVLGVILYLLVFYMKWKRTTQKKIPKLRSELNSVEIL
ncbi:unnamed protein product [Brassica rapa]|uniref:Uncharacterized protein n=1 Tax=Brassica campestris TaxID=3711 RepID=A0A3P5YYD0_BRACM|nr:unnamed protein product [Brassica rapa]VDC68365.1 unnamed protein product [Brassica rapa]